MKTYDLYWAPKGRKIATVSAETLFDAIRQIPKPYRKFRGEVYAERTPNAWAAVIRLWSPGYLLGGTRKHVSCGFVRKADAELFALGSVDTNRNRPGYENADIETEVVPCYDAKPIPAVD